MQNEAPKKYGNRRATSRARRLAVRRYERCIVDHQLDRDLMSDYAAMIGKQGTVASRALLDAAEGYQHPHRWLARRLIEAWMAEVPPDVAKRPLLRLLAWIEELYAARQSAEQHNQIVRTTTAA